ncbi:uroporphyrinogen-III C-methyltransferase [Sulfobacillus harzensis]|uniref:uroporphyrinogen-III C-methyltransferase n=1 Tax=Sulfobacillus harzensis TaxID=2729629 RepID=A0A7Y0L5W8_9FIRM|nr:uroporphyrinogen-III C-methyltransferase [Sulfobacillus harzensis]NMP23877.1 uroporphyrinogen-III C-methyltransferase [Sulfobacillus harzensis]
MTGTVYLVGAGPGDPELLTVKARRLLGEADAVLYDRLVHPEVLQYVRPGAFRQCVGKAPGGHGWSQEAINHELILMARRFAKVVRLKGGDPFLFGRGGEEAIALHDAGIRVEIVPGISSAWSAPALGAVPVTHRGVSAALMVVEGHDPDTMEWDILSKTEATLVLLMAMGNSPIIAAELVAHGRSGNTPAAVIERASYSDQRVVRTTLAQLATVIDKEQLSNPAVIVIGKVVDVLPPGLLSQLTSENPARFAL